MLPRASVISKTLPNVYKSCPKMISLEKLRILTSLQKLPKNGRLWKVALSPINRPIWSHCPRLQILLEHWSRESKYAAGSLTQSKTLNCKSHFFLRDSNQSPLDIKSNNRKRFSVRKQRKFEQRKRYQNAKTKQLKSSAFYSTKIVFVAAKFPRLGKV